MKHALIAAGYWLRPFDMLADRRRWRWQRRQPCGRVTFAGLPADVQTALSAAVEDAMKDRER